MRLRLTHRQQIFAEHFALSGRAGRSAIAAGCPRASASTTAFRWLKKADLQHRIRQIREKRFRILGIDVLKDLHDNFAFVIQAGSERDIQRVLRIADRLGIDREMLYKSEQEIKQELESRTFTAMQAEAVEDILRQKAWNRVRATQQRRQYANRKNRKAA